MLVDKFGWDGDRAAAVYNITNLTNSFLRRDGDNAAIRTTDMNSHIINNVADPL